jgi:hypothetical protein
MTDDGDVRRLALALPHVEEIDSDGFDFRVAGKGFIWSYPERRPGQPRVIRIDIAVLYVGDEAEKQALLLGEPRLFFTAPGYDGWPLVMLRLAEVGTTRLAELITDAWRMRAPGALAAGLDEDAAAGTDTQVDAGTVAGNGGEPGPHAARRPLPEIPHRYLALSPGPRNCNRTSTRFSEAGSISSRRNTYQRRA